jgi:DNA ligase (NAD+)
MNIVFTGTMREGNREEMEHQARSLGAKVLTSVSKHTQLLVCGEKVGGKKIDAASRLGIKIISESEYVALISSNTA